MMGEDDDVEEWAKNAIIKDSKLWRNGPASHIYDLVGVPDDCDNLDYSSVLQPEGYPWESPLRNEAEEQDQQLELAVKSILPSIEPKTETKPGNRLNQSVPQQAGDLQRVPDQRQISPKKIWLDEFYRTTASPPLVKKEESKAITGLKRRFDAFDESRSLYSPSSPDLIQEEEDEEEEEDKEEPLIPREADPNDKFSLVCQVQWEDDVVWEVPSNSPSQIIKGRQARVGWVPSPRRRKICPESEIEDERCFKSLLSFENMELVEGSWESEIIWDAHECRDKFLFPKLPVFDPADEDIVLKMPEDIPKASETPEKQQSAAVVPKRPVIQPHSMKSKELLGKTGLINSRWRREEFEQQQNRRLHEKQRQDVIPTKKSRFEWTENISNDNYYDPKVDNVVTIYYCRHSRLIKDMVPPFICTHLNAEQLRNFHRPKLSATVNAPAPTGIDPDRHYFKSLSKRIKVKQDERKKLMSQGHLILFDKEIDVSGRDGTLILIENSEEHPPLLSQVGMCSRILNYYKRKSLNEHEFAPAIPHNFGETNYVSNSSFFPFLGSLESGQVLSAICNNMYNSPIYWHGKNETDMLIIRTKMSGYLIRDLDGQFVAGQQCPLIEVLEPNSFKMKNFLKDFVIAFVYRKYRAFFPPKGEDGSFKGPKETPKVKMEVITQHFPTLGENNIKTMLRNSSEVKRVGNKTWMVLKEGFVLPDEEELADKLPPEQICAYYSSLAAEQRLRDAGLDSMLTLPDRGQDELEKKGKKPLNPPVSLLESAGGKLQGQQQQQQHSQSVFEEELLSAPWNTTSAFVAAAKKKCLLQIIGSADPTGCGEGYSYVRAAKRGAGGLSTAVNGNGEPIPHYSGRGRPRKNPPKTGGTDADLRKLSSKTAKELLKKVGLPEKDIQKLSRWEVIDLVRTLSTEKVMKGETNDKAMTKYCRWKSIHSVTMNQERYKEACQKVFELQNKVLSSSEVLSTDEEDSEDENENALAGDTSMKDIEQMGKNIERILYGDADMDRLTHEEEELERLELQKMMLGGIRAKDAEFAKRKAVLKREKEMAQKSKENSQDILTDLMKHPGKYLKICRTFKDGETGSTFVRTEIIRNPVVIAAYLRIRESKSEEFIKQFLQKADRREKKEQKERDRMLLGQLQDVVQVEERKVFRLTTKRKREMEDEYFPSKEAKREAEKALRRQTRKCGACGIPGHMKTSKECPFYARTQEKIEELLKKQEMKKVGGGPKIRILPLTGPTQQEAAKEPDTDSDDDSSSDDSDSSSSSDTENEHFSEPEYSGNEISRSQSSTSAQSSQEEPIVKTDGLKMFVKKSSIQEMIIQAQEQDAKEQEVARILAAMAVEGNATGTPAATSRRRTSQTDKTEDLEYLTGRKYRTTAADRRSARL